MENQEFVVMQSRFDRIEKILYDQDKKAEVVKDALVLAKADVARHDTYWKITIWVAGTTVGGGVLAFFGLK